MKRERKIKEFIKVVFMYTETKTLKILISAESKSFSPHLRSFPFICRDFPMDRSCRYSSTEG